MPPPEPGGRLADDGLGLPPRGMASDSQDKRPADPRVCGFEGGRVGLQGGKQRTQPHSLGALGHLDHPPEGLPEEFTGLSRGRAAGQEPQAHRRAIGYAG